MIPNSYNVDTGYWCKRIARHNEKILKVETMTETTYFSKIVSPSNFSQWLDYYDNGIVVDVDKEKAFDLYKIAANKGNSNAQKSIAYLYEQWTN